MTEEPDAPEKIAAPPGTKAKDGGNIALATAARVLFLGCSSHLGICDWVGTEADKDMQRTIQMLGQEEAIWIVSVIAFCFEHLASDQETSVDTRVYSQHFTLGTWPALACLAQVIIAVSLALQQQSSEGEDTVSDCGAARSEIVRGDGFRVILKSLQRSLISLLALSNLPSDPAFILRSCFAAIRCLVMLDCPEDRKLIGHLETESNAVGFKHARGGTKDDLFGDLDDAAFLAIDLDSANNEIEYGSAPPREHFSSCWTLLENLLTLSTVSFATLILETCQLDSRCSE